MQQIKSKLCSPSELDKGSSVLITTKSTIYVQRTVKAAHAHSGPTRCAALQRSPEATQMQRSLRSENQRK